MIGVIHLDYARVRLFRYFGLSISAIESLRTSLGRLLGPIWPILFISRGIRISLPIRLCPCHSWSKDRCSLVLGINFNFCIFQRLILTVFFQLSLALLVTEAIIRSVVIQIYI